jgi:hypothetical protein
VAKLALPVVVEVALPSPILAVVEVDFPPRILAVVFVHLEVELFHSC